MTRRLGLKKRFSEEQINGFLRQAEAGLPIKDLCRQHGPNEASYSRRGSKFGGMSVPDAKRLKDLGGGEQLLEEAISRAGLRERRHRGCFREKLVTPPAVGAEHGRRKAERAVCTDCCSPERKCVSLRAQAGSQCGTARADRCARAWHRRYGVGMIHLKPGKKDLVVNYKRVERPYPEQLCCWRSFSPPSGRAR